MLTSGPSSPNLRSTLASIYLQIGDLGSASHHLEILEREEGADQDIKTSNLILQAAFLGNWGKAIQLLQARQEEATSQDKHVQRAIVSVIEGNSPCFTDYKQDANNLSVALLNQGRLSEGIAVLEGAFRNMPSITVVAEPLIFNLGEKVHFRVNS